MHLEWRPLKYIQPECDVVVIAGDGGPGFQLVDWVEKELSTLDIPVVVIAGNHEFYGRNLHHHMSDLKTRYRNMGVDFLHNESVIIKDTLFIGGTLWTDFNLFGNSVMQMLKAPGVMNDYLHITGEASLITPDEILSEHNKTKAFISTVIANNKKDTHPLKTCVVTHHAPSAQSLGRNKTNQFAPMYASNLESDILEWQPDVWLHGHIHTPVEYFIGDTLVMSNPRGRRGENPNFEIEMTIKI